MGRLKRRFLAVLGLCILVAPTLLATGPAALAGGGHGNPPPPKRVLIVLFDQMIPAYANQFDMPNFRRLRDRGTNFKDAYLGYMASETVMAHNVITSGLQPKNMGWVDEAYRDVDNLFGKGAGAMHITGDISRADFGTLIADANYPKLADYLRAAYPGTKFISVGEKSYAVDSIAAPSAVETGDIAVRMSSRSANVDSPCRTTLGGRYRLPAGLNVPSYLLADCGRWYINSDASISYGTSTAFPSFMYPEDGDRFFPGTGAAAMAGHLGGDNWVADAAVAMMDEPWSGMFVTMGGIDKAAHMWGAQQDAATFKGDCNDPDPIVRGANQTHVRCAAENADVQLGKMLAKVAQVDAARGGETLVVMTADHGATYGETFYGKPDANAGNSNWYYAPNGVWDAGSAGAFDTVTYTNPSPAIAPLINSNLLFSYQSTAIENWLIDTSTTAMKTQAAAMLTTPGVIAAYWRDGDRFRLYGTNTMSWSEKRWWREHGQEIVNTMAAPNGPDVVGLLKDKVSYGVYGDHGGASESVQRVPMVFWSPSIAKSRGHAGDGPFRTTDVMPTILKAMGIPLTQPVDGKARSIR